MAWRGQTTGPPFQPFHSPSSEKNKRFSADLRRMLFQSSSSTKPNSRMCCVRWWFDSCWGSVRRDIGSVWARWKVSEPPAVRHCSPLHPPFAIFTSRWLRSSGTALLCRLRFQSPSLIRRGDADAFDKKCVKYFDWLCIVTCDLFTRSLVISQICHCNLLGESGFRILVSWKRNFAALKQSQLWLPHISPHPHHHHHPTPYQSFTRAQASTEVAACCWCLHLRNKPSSST